MLAWAKQRGRHRQSALAFKRFDRRTGGNPAVERQFDHVIGRLGCKRTCGGRGHCHHVARAARRCHILGLANHLKRPRTVGQAAQKPALLQRGNQAMHARLALEIERFLHFLETRRDPGFFQPLLDETDQLVLLGCQH